MKRKIHFVLSDIRFCGSAQARQFTKIPDEVTCCLCIKNRSLDKWIDADQKHRDTIMKLAVEAGHDMDKWRKCPWRSHGSNQPGFVPNWEMGGVPLYETSCSGGCDCVMVNSSVSMEEFIKNLEKHEDGLSTHGRSYEPST
jgi:hypothetical protein